MAEWPMADDRGGVPGQPSVMSHQPPSTNPSFLVPSLRAPELDEPAGHDRPDHGIARLLPSRMFPFRQCCEQRIRPVVPISAGDQPIGKRKGFVEYGVIQSRTAALVYRKAFIG